MNFSSKSLCVDVLSEHCLIGVFPYQSNRLKSVIILGDRFWLLQRLVYIFQLGLKYWSYLLVLLLHVDILQKMEYSKLLTFIKYYTFIYCYLFLECLYLFVNIRFLCFEEFKSLMQENMFQQTLNSLSSEEMCVFKREIF